MTQDNITPEELVKELRDCEDDCMECPIAVREVSCLVLATAADLIEQQAEKIKELQAKVPRWIPVTKKIPPDQEEVLVLTRSKNGVRNVDKGYWAIDHFIHRGRAEVTHWMPLPGWLEEGQNE